MKTDDRRKRVAILLGMGLLIVATSAQAQPPSTNFNFSATPVYQFDSDLDSGGEAGFAGGFIMASKGWSMTERSTVGVSVNFSYEDWHFDAPGAFGGIDPWDEAYQSGLSIPFTYAAANDWFLGFTPTVNFAGESGADFFDALEYGAFVTAVKKVHSNLILGIGLGAYEQIEDTNIFPILIVDWWINDRLRLSNPAFVSPSGPAGLELSYLIGSGWDVGVGGAYRSNRFRLDEDGSFANGVGEHSYNVVMARTGYEFSETFRCDVYVGTILNSELRVEDENGDLLYTDDRDPAATVGFSLVGQF